MANIIRTTVFNCQALYQARLGALQPEIFAELYRGYLISTEECRNTITGKVDARNG
jgi:hypothetical protein